MNVVNTPVPGLQWKFRLYSRLSQRTRARSLLDCCVLCCTAAVRLKAELPKISVGFSRDIARVQCSCTCLPLSVYSYCSLVDSNSNGEQREDLTIPELGLHFDSMIGALDEIGENNYPTLNLGDDGRVKTALQEKASAAWMAAAQRVAFGTLTRTAAEMRTHHSPAVVTPLAVSAGGGMFRDPEDDDRLPCGADRNGRHWLRIELSSTLLKFRTALTWQLWKRRPNSVFAQAT